MIDTLLRIGVFLDKNGISWRRIEWECKETPKLYKLSRTDKYGDFNKREIKKEQLMVVNSNIIATTQHIEFNVWTTPEREAEARNILVMRVSTAAARMRDELNALLSHIVIVEDGQQHTLAENAHVCRYSKAMDQTYPRLCVDCGKPESQPANVDALMKHFWSATAGLIDQHRKDGDERGAQGVVDSRILINRLVQELNKKP